MLKGFRDFLMRGNIVDLAIAVVIGTAFTALVSAVVRGLIDPLVRIVLGGGAMGGTVEVRGVIFDVAGVLNAIITFVVTAAVLYFLVVVPMKKLAARRAAGDADAPTPTPTDEAVLLTEIRDLLAKR